MVVLGLAALSRGPEAQWEPGFPVLLSKFGNLLDFSFLLLLSLLL
jgi:hypothetical protein